MSYVYDEDDRVVTVQYGPKLTKKALKVKIFKCPNEQINTLKMHRLI